MSKQPHPAKPSTPDSGEQSYSPESWEEARKIAALVGQVPSSFTSAVHFLRKDCDSSTGMLSQGSRFSMGRLLKSPIFSAPLYFGAETFFENEAAQCDHIDINTFADMFGPDGLAVAVALLYLYRRVGKGCDEEEWKYLSQNIIIESELGAHLGRAIPNIGLPLGLLIGGMRHLATGMFLQVDQKNFVAYRRLRKDKPYNFDMQWELKTWGCNHAQIAAIILQTVGLGVNMTDALLGGLNPVELPFDLLDPGALRVKLISLWIPALRGTGVQPDMTHIGKYYPLKADLEKLINQTEAIRMGGSKYRWLDRGRDDVSPEKTPRLYGITPAKVTEVIELDKSQEAAEVEQEFAELEA